MIWKKSVNQFGELKKLKVDKLFETPLEKNLYPHLCIHAHNMQFFVVLEICFSRKKQEDSKDFV